jgi:hypothetical protein
MASELDLGPAVVGRDGVEELRIPGLHASPLGRVLVLRVVRVGRLIDTARFVEFPCESVNSLLERLLLVFGIREMCSY